MDNEGVEALNQKFWNKFEKADFSNTTFGLSYMKDEDMDPTAYEDITKSLYYSGLRFSVREHQVDTTTIHIRRQLGLSIFYRMILENDFGRKSKNVQKQEIRNLVGLKPQSYMYGSKIVKRKWFCAILQSFGAIRNGNPVLDGHPKLSSGRTQPALHF
ncbi:MAG: accessory Sec system protein Asp2 [Streptococcus sp.]